MFPRPKEVKHIACSRCRERKVRCDGGKPACRRCQRLGHECQYIQGKKQKGKGEWVQHLGIFNAQPGKTTPSTTSLTQSHTSQLSKSALPNSTLRVSNAESAFQYSRPSSPYLVLSSSQPESMVFDAERPFSNSDIMATWMPPVSTSTPTPLGDGVLDLHMFTFSPSQTCYDMSYRSELTTPSGNVWFLQGGQPSGGDEYTAFDS